MALKARAGSTVRFLIHVAVRDTLAPIEGAPVFLDRIDQPAGPPVQLAGAQTDGEGNAVISTTLPTTPGTYGYRSRTPGVAERFRPDTSSVVSIEAVAV